MPHSWLNMLSMLVVMSCCNSEYIICSQDEGIIMLDHHMLRALSIDYLMCAMRQCFYCASYSVASAILGLTLSIPLFQLYVSLPFDVPSTSRDRSLVQDWYHYLCNTFILCKTELSYLGLPSLPPEALPLHVAWFLVLFEVKIISKF